MRNMNNYKELKVWQNEIEKMLKALIKSKT
jgi:hypothetical protein